MPNYAMDHSARTTGYVSQGAADYCKANGHAYWIVDGEDQGVCPRCLTITETETETANEETDTMSDYTTETRTALETFGLDWKGMSADHFEVARTLVQCDAEGMSVFSALSDEQRRIARQLGLAG